MDLEYVPFLLSQIQPFHTLLEQIHITLQLFELEIHCILGHLDFAQLDGALVGAAHGRPDLEVIFQISNPNGTKTEDWFFTTATLPAQVLRWIEAARRRTRKDVDPVFGGAIVGDVQKQDIFISIGTRELVPYILDWEKVDQALVHAERDHPRLRVVFQVRELYGQRFKNLLHVIANGYPSIWQRTGGCELSVVLGRTISCLEVPSKATFESFGFAVLRIFIGD
ncbi:hypothetical protein BKA93DRAFT_823904 [Sparassis latifolia]